MSYHDKWCTKADIVKDLEEATGRLNDVDEKYIVSGKKPPPRRSIDGDEDEINLRFGYQLYQGEYVQPPPDLEGISEMLRMVDEYNQDEGIDLAPMKSSDCLLISKLNPEVPEFVPNSAPDIVPIAATNIPEVVPIHPTSSLKVKPFNENIVHVNNSVRKFNSDLNNKDNLNEQKQCTNIKSNRPKRSITNFNNLNEYKKSNEAKSKEDVNLPPKTHFNNIKEFKLGTKSNGIINNDDPMSSTNHVDLYDKKQKCDIGFKINRRLEISELNENEIKEMTMKLRSKISDASSNDQAQSKREKNVAIAALLKLYSATTPRQANSPVLESFDNADNTPIKLFTPEYFEKRPVKPSLGKNQVLCKAHGVIVDVGSNPNASNVNISKDSKPPNKTTNIAGIQASKNNKSSSNKQREHEGRAPMPKLEVGSPNKNKYAESPEINNSIDKVNKWFEKPESPKPKGLTVCLGPIAFKRKTSVTKSPVSDADRSSLSTPTSNEPPQINQYKPSKYAEELSRKFMEQGKALEKQHMDVWQRAELMMKEKEKLKRKEQSCSSQETTDDTGSEPI